jgi:hypothetical protein
METAVPAQVRTQGAASGPRFALIGQTDRRACVSAPIYPVIEHDDHVAAFCAGITAPAVDERGAGSNCP